MRFTLDNQEVNRSHKTLPQAPLEQSVAIVPEIMKAMNVYSIKKDMNILTTKNTTWSSP